MKILVLILGLLGPNLALRLPKIFKNEMVLQASPEKAVIWGFLDGNQNEVGIEADCTPSFKEPLRVHNYADDKFKVEIPDNKEGNVCNFRLKQEGSEVSFSKNAS